YASSFDQIGIFAHTIEDAALVLEVIAGADAFDSTVSEQPVPAYSREIEAAGQRCLYKFAYFRESLEHPGLDPEIKAATEAYINRLAEAGHSVEPVDFELLEYVVPTYYVLTTAE
ncbi:hypothetical protein LZ318_01395, partial [Saccharopolyspora indica]|uniref:amidase family protein n=1 Tax=Saccharopolyspora indica TaxID=1229659 RepID=UPI002FE51BF8